MIESLTIVRPGIDVGIEMDQRKLAKFLGMGFQQRISHKVITTECQHGDVLRKQLLSVSLNDGDRLVGVTRHKFHIAPISNCKLIKRIEIEGIGIGQQFCQLNTSRSNGLGPKSGARAKCCGEIKRQTRHHHICPRNLSRGFPAKEGIGAAKGLLRFPRAKQITSWMVAIR